MDTSSPTTRPSTATLKEGVFPWEIAKTDTPYTQPTLVSCSMSCEAAGMPVFLVP